VRVLIVADILANAVTGVERYTLELIHALGRHPQIELSVLVRAA
jgi:hypothetical protein